MPYASLNRSSAAEALVGEKINQVCCGSCAQGVPCAGALGQAEGGGTAMERHDAKIGFGLGLSIGLIVGAVLGAKATSDFFRDAR